jgi:hypothetical protein
MMKLAQLPSTAALALLEKYNVAIVAVHKTTSAEQREALKTFVKNFPTWEITYIAPDEFLIHRNQ